MTLGEKQRRFAHLLGQLLIWIYSHPTWGVTLGEAERKKEEALRNAAQGDGIANSLHLIRLAIDLNLFIDGQYRTDLEAYRPLGEFWKSLDPACCWGGDFSHPDADHFSYTHNGVR